MWIECSFSTGEFVFGTCEKVMNTDVFKLRSSNVGLGTIDLENPVDALLPARVPHVGEKDTAVRERKCHGSAG